MEGYLSSSNMKRRLGIRTTSHGATRVLVQATTGSVHPQTVLSRDGRALEALEKACTSGSKLGLSEDHFPSRKAIKRL